MARSYTAERTIGGQIVYDRSGNPLEKHLDVARLCEHGFDWGPDADDRAVLQLAIAILADRRTWTTAVEHYRDLAAYIQDEFGEEDEWELRSLEITDAIEETDGSDRFDQHLPQPGEVDVEEVDLDEISQAERYALYERYGIEKHSFKAEEKLRLVKEQGPAALVDDEDETNGTSTSLGEFDEEDSSSSDSEASEDDETATDRPSDDSESSDQDQNGTASDGPTAEEDQGADRAAEDTGADESTIAVAGDEVTSAPTRASVGETTPEGDQSAPATEESRDNSEEDGEEVLAADGAGSGEDLDGGRPPSGGPEPASPDEATDTTDRDEQPDVGDDEPRSPVPATTDTLLTGFPELTEEMAETVADTVETIPGLLAQTPNDLLTADGIDRTVVTRLTETISWQTSVPIGEQNTPDIDLSAEDTGADDTDEDDSNADVPGDSDDDVDGDDADSAENPSVDEEGAEDASGNEEDTDAGDDQDLNAGEDSDIGSCSVWNPTRIGYSVAGANGAQIYRECESLGNFDVFMQSDSGDLYQVAAGVDKTEADRTMNRLAASIAPVDIERGVEEFGPLLDDIKGASLVEAPGSNGDHEQTEESRSEAPVDEPEADEATAGSDEAEEQDEDGNEGELPHEMPESLGSLDLDRVDVDDDADLTDFCYSDESDIPGVDEIVVTVRLLNGSWEVYVGPDGETHPRGTFETKEKAVEQARTIATENIGSSHAAGSPSESDRETEPDTGENEGSPSSGDSEESPGDEAEGDADAEFSGEDVKSAFDVHGPPAFALADAFECQEDLVAMVENNGKAALTDIDGVGETTAQRVHEQVITADTVVCGDDAERPDSLADEFLWVGEEKPIQPA